MYRRLLWTTLHHRNIRDTETHARLLCIIDYKQYRCRRVCNVCMYIYAANKHVLRLRIRTSNPTIQYIMSPIWLFLLGLLRHAACSQIKHMHEQPYFDIPSWRQYAENNGTSISLRMWTWQARTHPGHSLEHGVGHVECDTYPALISCINAHTSIDNSSTISLQHHFLRREWT